MFRATVSDRTGIISENFSSASAAGLDSTAAMVRAEADHLEATLRALVMRLSSVPALKMAVSHRHGRFRRLLGDLPYINDLNRRTGPIQKIVVTIGSRSYWLRRDHGAISCGTEGNLSEQGQPNEELPFSVWARTLLDDIARQNLINHDSMVALRRLVEHDLVD